MATSNEPKVLKMHILRYQPAQENWVVAVKPAKECLVDIISIHYLLLPENDEIKAEDRDIGFLGQFDVLTLNDHKLQVIANLVNGTEIRKTIYLSVENDVSVTVSDAVGAGTMPENQKPKINTSYPVTKRDKGATDSQPIKT